MHDTRHCYASKLVQRGASLQQIKELPEHSSIKMVLRYAHLIPSNLDEGCQSARRCLASRPAATG
jgi:site-specific recombinase XerD